MNVLSVVAVHVIIPKPANEFGTKPTHSSAALRFVLPSSQINATLNGYQLITNISAVLLGFRQENSFNGVLQLLIGCKNNILLFLTNVSSRVTVHGKGMTHQLNTAFVVENDQCREDTFSVWRETTKSKNFYMFCANTKAKMQTDAKPFKSDQKCTNGTFYLYCMLFFSWIFII